MLEQTRETRLQELQDLLKSNSINEDNYHQGKLKILQELEAIKYMINRTVFVRNSLDSMIRVRYNMKLVLEKYGSVQLLLVTYQIDVILLDMSDQTISDVEIIPLPQLDGYYLKPIFMVEFPKSRIPSEMYQKKDPPVCSPPGPSIHAGCLSYCGN
ncbi:hypothetical protein DFA_04040 [Cavenderia fasciculata]|uniref:Uncharacterized protein n=1 Tax=Cavenderia fasciculata TaxID=261658 RepID=F4Q145_CACFS|nr:uncharacterized protein DFA_04040 [Cavenderia fasciculata]EGG18546.1 hypothetical protein DFA_04040 [Cavenderia fasciculata]|eukprot:XP_004366450.1 hypothetical protein DFA_04040 [Cavenderia fasciculata]